MPLVELTAAQAWDWLPGFLGYSALFLGLAGGLAAQIYLHWPSGEEQEQQGPLPRWRQTSEVVLGLALATAFVLLTRKAF